MSRLSMPQLLTRSSVLMAARLVGGALAFVVNIVIARQFGADTLGLFALTMALVSLLALVLPFGYQAVGVMFVSQYVERGRADLIRGFVRRGYRNIAIAGAIVGLGLFGILSVISDPALRHYALSAIYVLAMAPALALLNLNGSVLTAHRRQYGALLPDLLLKPALMLAGIAFLAMAVWQVSVDMLLATAAAALWASALWQAVLIRRAGLIPRGTEAAHEPATWRKAALPWMAISLLADYFIELNLLLAGFLAAPAEVAVLHICFRLRVLAAFGLRALYALVLPDIFASHERGDHAEFRQNILRANTLALIYALAVCAVVAAFGAEILAVVGDGFKAGHMALLIVCLPMVTRAVFGPTTAIMAIKGHHSSALWILCAGLVMAVGTGIALFPSLGVDGIAIGFALSYSLIAMGQWLWIKRRTGIDCSLFAAFRASPEPVAI
ncbi:MAG: lipopolysaccharide biosynthesis protein [Hyphomicrobiales bacterium]